MLFFLFSVRGTIVLWLSAVFMPLPCARRLSAFPVLGIETPSGLAADFFVIYYPTSSPSSSASRGPGRPAAQTCQGSSLHGGGGGVQNKGNGEDSAFLPQTEPLMTSGRGRDRSCDTDTNGNIVHPSKKACIARMRTAHLALCWQPPDKTRSLLEPPLVCKGTRTRTKAASEGGADT